MASNDCGTLPFHKKPNSNQLTFYSMHSDNNTGNPEFCGRVGLASCATYSGNVAIATGVTGGFALIGIQEIQGNFTAKNVTQITGLSSAA